MPRSHAFGLQELQEFLGGQLAVAQDRVQGAALDVALSVRDGGVQLRTALVAELVVAAADAAHHEAGTLQGANDLLGSQRRELSAHAGWRVTLTVSMIGAAAGSSLSGIG